MALTQAQLVILKAAIVADPVLDAYPNNSDGAFAIAAILNQEVVPNFYVWRSQLSLDTITQNGFDWVEVDNLTASKARIWEWLFENDTRSINPSKANVRAGIAECWKGTAGKNAVRLSVFQHCQKLATRFEKIFATGLGTVTDGDGVGPATTSVTGSVSYAEVEAARNLV